MSLEIEKNNKFEITKSLMFLYDYCFYMIKTMIKTNFNKFKFVKIIKNYRKLNFNYNTKNKFLNNLILNLDKNVIFFSYLFSIQ